MYWNNHLLRVTSTTYKYFVKKKNKQKILYCMTHYEYECSSMCYCCCCNSSISISWPFLFFVVVFFYCLKIKHYFTRILDLDSARKYFVCFLGSSSSSPSPFRQLHYSIVYVWCYSLLSSHCCSIFFIYSGVYICTLFTVLCRFSFFEVRKL